MSGPAADLPSLCRNLLTLDPARQAIGYDGIWHNWGAVNRLASELEFQLGSRGVDPGAPVTVVARNRPGILAAVVALLAQGRSLSMVYAFQSRAAVAAAVESLASQAVVFAAEDFGAEAATVVERCGMAGLAIEGLEVAGRYVVAGEGHRQGGAAGYIEVLTSGTTGPPKRLPIGFDIVEKLVAGSGMVTGSQAEADAPPFLFSMPLGNISGIYCMAASILQGRRTQLLDRFTLEDWLEYIRTWRPAVGSAPPAAIGMILQAGIAPEEFASIRYFTTGAAPLDPVIHRAFEDKYGIPILLSYGATEFGGPVAMMTPQLQEEFGSRKFGSVGRAMPGVRLRVVDAETGAECPPGEEGLLQVVSPRIGSDWIATADIAVIDEDQFLWHRGRADGAIMRGGFKIVPESIERSLMTHGSLVAAAVVGVADDRLHQVPGAAVQVKAGAPEPSPAELEAYLRERLLATHIPVHWRVVDELPRTGSLKVDRLAVAKLFD